MPNASSDQSAAQSGQNLLRSHSVPMHLPQAATNSVPQYYTTSMVPVALAAAPNFQYVQPQYPHPISPHIAHQYNTYAFSDTVYNPAVPIINGHDDLPVLTQSDLTYLDEEPDNTLL